jgi:hypothetical protein
MEESHTWGVDDDVRHVGTLDSAIDRARLRREGAEAEAGNFGRDSNELGEPEFVDEVGAAVRRGTMPARQVTAGMPGYQEVEAAARRTSEREKEKQARPARAAQHQRQETDPTKDWLLDETHFSAKAQAQLLAMVASLSLNTSYQAKINRSIIIDPAQMTNAVPEIAALIDGAKKDTSEFHTIMKTASPEERDAAYPTHVLVWRHVVIFAKKATEMHLDQQDPDRLHVCRYADDLERLSGETQAEFIADQIRYCRLRSTYAKRFTMLEVGVACMAPESARLWAITKRLMVRYFRTRMRCGVAPKSGMERRIEATLRRLRVWANRK